MVKKVQAMAGRIFYGCPTARGDIGWLAYKFHCALIGGVELIYGRDSEHRATGVWYSFCIQVNHQLDLCTGKLECYSFTLAPGFFQAKLIAIKLQCTFQIAHRRIEDT